MARSLTTKPDPIFVKIEKYRLTEAHLNECCYLTDSVAARQAGRVVTDADEEMVEAAHTAASEALDDIFATVPNSVSGLKALLETLLNEVMDDLIYAGLSTALKAPVFASPSPSKTERASFTQAAG